MAWYFELLSFILYFALEKIPSLKTPSSGELLQLQLTFLKSVLFKFILQK